MGDVSNRLFAALDPSDRDYMTMRVREVELASRQVLIEPNTSIDRIFFPLTGVIAQFVLSGTGVPVAAVAVGHAGLIGLNCCLSGLPSFTRHLMLMPGRALSLDRASLLQAAEERSSLRRVFAAYADAFMAEVLQSAACLVAHSLEERLARCLLSHTDDCERTELPMGEDSLSVLLGVRQSRLMLAARTLQKLGLIDYRPDYFNVVNRAGLEDIACECYGVIKARYGQAFLPIAVQ